MPPAGHDVLQTPPRQSCDVDADPVTARLVVVAEVVVERPILRFVNVELAVAIIPLLKF